MTCAKVGIRSEAKAKRALRHYRKKYPDAMMQHVYLCEDCGRWHIGATKEYSRAGRILRRWTP